MGSAPGDSSDGNVEEDEIDIMTRITKAKGTVRQLGSNIRHKLTQYR